MTGNSTGPIPSEHLLSYIILKSERIDTALYLLTDLLEKDEPLRDSLRRAGNELVYSTASFAASVSGVTLADKKKSIAALYRIISLLSVAGSSQVVSEDSSEIISTECRMLGDTIANADSGQGAFVLPEAFFEPGGSFRPLPEVGMRMTEKDMSHKGHEVLSDMIRPSRTSVRTHHTQSSRTSAASNPKGGERHGKILGLLTALPAGSSLAIRDVFAAFEGVSEKTIQRDLLQLVALGKLEKTGERRWSRYSITKG